MLACGTSGDKTSGTSGGTGGAGTGGSSSGGGGSSPTGGALTLTSSVFQDSATIPAEYRCVAPSPDLAWSGGPSGAMSYALVFQDVTPGISKGFFHWMLYDIPKLATSLPKGVPVGYAPNPPEGAHQAPIWNRTLGFSGPCGGNNTYELTLHSLDVATLPGASQTSTAVEILTTIESHDLEKVTMTVTSVP
jgi:phosphatidylethanolamine-binding protein (PEBP) family uncharacterized protein